MQPSPLGRFTVVVLFATTLVGCVGRDEVARVTSPSGHLDAVLIETNGGATTSFGYVAFLVETGRGPSSGIRVASWYGATRSDQAYGVNLRWRDANTLALEYLTAKEESLERSSALIRGELVRVQLVGGVSDATAPPGGMLYNLKGRPYG
jgi:hypothetical protein